MYRQSIIEAQNTRRDEGEASMQARVMMSPAYCDLAELKKICGMYQQNHKYNILREFSLFAWLTS